MEKHPNFMQVQANPLIESFNNFYKKTEEKDAINIDMVSREHIKPASPTPEHLRYHKLSMFDQTQSSIYHPFTFFYQNCNPKKKVEETIREQSKYLKQSLSDMLTRFYPFAGKVGSELHIECNDDGVYYIETRVDECLMTVLEKPDKKFLQRLAPVVVSVPNQPLSGSYISMVQINFFNCGGVAITVQHNHKLVDGGSFMIFLKAWAAMDRKDPNQIYPSFVSSSTFPQNTQLPSSPYIPLWCLTMSPALLKLGKCSCKRFVFEPLALRELKAKASKHQPVSRITAVLALLWKCVTTETQSKPSILHVPVNIRSRCSPPLPESAVGNNLLGTYAKFDPDTSDLDVASMAGKLRNAISSVDSNMIEELKREKGHIRFVESMRSSMETFSDYKREYYLTTSMCNSGTNEVDFGWGKPVWSSYGNINEDIPLFMNRVILMDSCSNGGIEVWVTLEEHVMDVVTCNPELLSFAKVDPSPL
ncbi:transferase, Chloramphenicol acetyltransferase-like domain protein [Artemisia annua]|uniref:Transferase, Chloramphenicol acetyltransferase-like domain protein n=1 Tax=Artemisia annua TaxID=35608 RepID=A0A2U1Q879_ARTAN|nr:transferase, Chloramphenicol acetyltransferase-like domain protein [Artemisia annua]